MTDTRTPFPGEYADPQPASVDVAGDPARKSILAIAPRLAVDANGYCWRVFPVDEFNDEEVWSMCPVNPDNEPIPQPVIFYIPEGETDQ